MSDVIALKKRKLELNRETIMPLERGVLAGVLGGDNLVVDAVTSAAGSAVTGGVVSAFIGESLTACPAVGASISGVGSVLSHFFCK